MRSINNHSYGNGTHLINTFGKKILHYRPPRISMLLLIIASAMHGFMPPLRVVVFASPLLALAIGVTGFAIMMWAWWLFQKAETAICPTAKSSKLVTKGIYSFTQHPMYLGIIMMMAGVSVWFGSLPYYFVTVVYILVIRLVFCPFEEEQLTQQFGEDYISYRKMVWG